MKTNRYTEAQIIAIRRQAEGGVPVAVTALFDNPGRLMTYAATFAEDLRGG